MLDKFLFSLSLEHLVACLLPKTTKTLRRKITICARQEISTILEESANYYHIDVSIERKNLSKSRLIKCMQKNSVHTTAITYIATLLKLFDDEQHRFNSINEFFVEPIDQTLSLDNITKNSEIYSAIEKLHAHHIYAHTSINNRWAWEEILEKTSSWTTKLRNPLLFDGIEDALENIIYDILDRFPLLSLIGKAHSICSKQEVVALIDCLTLKARQATLNHSNIINQITKCLNLEDAWEQ